MMNRNMAAIMWAYEARGISPTAWRVLAMLAKRVNSHRTDWEVWPSQKLLAEECEISLTGLRRHLDELQAAKYIFREQGFRDDNGLSTCRYRLAIDVAIAMPDGRVDTFGGYDPSVKLEGGSLQSGGGASSKAGGGATSTAGGCIGTSKDRTSEDRTPPKPPEGDDDDGGDLPVIAVTDQQIADRYIAAWGKLIEHAPKLDPIGRFSEQRRTELLARLKDHGIPRDIETIDEFLTMILGRVAGNRWLRGDENRDWRASYGWVLKRANFDKIQEGFYAQNYTAGAAEQRSDRPAERSMVAAGQEVLDILRARDRTA